MFLTEHVSLGRGWSTWTGSVWGVSNVNLARHFCLVFWFFFYTGGASCGADGWSCWGWSPLVTLGSARDAVPGMPTRAWAPPQPSATFPESIRTEKPSRPCSPSSRHRSGAFASCSSPGMQESSRAGGSGAAGTEPAVAHLPLRRQLAATPARGPAGKRNK